ncbi:MAG: PaaI family thioesterase [Actinomycetota bacterium]
MPYTPITDEPARGDFPPVGLLGYAGPERARIFAQRMTPRPPISHLFGLMPADRTEDEAVFTMPATPWLQTSYGVFFASTAVLAADAPFGSALVPKMEPGVFGTTSELSMSFLRPASPSSGVLTARARAIDAGRTLGLSEATVSDARGKLLAHGTSRYVFLRIDPPPKPMELVPYEEPAYDTPDPYERPVQGEVYPREIWGSMSGLDVLRASAAGELPPAPFALLFGLKLEDVEEGSLTSVMPASGWFASPARSIYGGITAFFADTAITAAIQTTLPANSVCALVDLKVNFTRPALPDGRMLRARASVVHRGRQMAVARADLVNADGKTYAIATGSAMILEGRVWDAERPVVVADEARGDEE